MTKKMIQIRQGDVFLMQVPNLPEGCAEVPLERGRIVLMHGETTGHAHAIADWASAERIAKDAIGLAGRRARLLQGTDGTRYLEVGETVSLTHEEHTAHPIPPGVYELPIQVEWTTAHAARQVAD